MAFEINKSIIQGTSGHRSALKSGEYDRAAQKDANLGSYVAERKKIKAKYGGDRKKYKSSDEYKINQAKINKAYGVGGKKSSSSTTNKSSGNSTGSKTKQKSSSTPTNGNKGTDFYGKKVTEPIASTAGTTYLGAHAVKSKLGQKVLTKTVGKGATKVATKLATRAIPGLGWALAAYDVAKLGYYTVKKGSFKEGLKDLGRDYGADDLGLYE